MYEAIGRKFPIKIRNDIKELLVYAGISVNPDKYLGLNLIFGLFLSFVISLISGMFGYNHLLIFMISFFAIDVFIYAGLQFKADAKGKFVEKILPDVLRLMAGNLKAGITTDKALILSARPEFGVFKDELIRIGKEIATGKNIVESLMDVTKRVRSEKLKNVFELIVSGLKTGGQLSDLLEQTAEDLSSQKLIERKIRTNVKLYVTFIFIAISVASPIMYALAIFLAEILSKHISSIDISSSVISLPFLNGEMIQISFMIKYVLISIATTILLGSLVLGQISKGDEKQGLKQIPSLAFLAFLLFFLVLWGLRVLFGSLLL